MTVYPGPSVQYRTERAGEEDAVRAVVADAFPRDPAVPELVDALRVSRHWIDGLSFVAQLGGSLVGHILFTRAWLDASPRLLDVLVLSPVSVAAAHQGRGIGSGLIRHGLDAIRARPEPLVFLEGDPAYYVRFGFDAAGQHGFRRPSLRIPEAAFQVIRHSTHEPWMTGTLVYPEAFWLLDCVGLRDTTP